MLYKVYAILWLMADGYSASEVEAQ